VRYLLGAGQPVPERLFVFERKNMTRKFEGIWIPRDIWLSTDFSVIEKIFIVEINSLDNEKGCYASNKYFSEFFKLSKSRVSQIITALIEKQIISAEYIREGKQVKKRILKIKQGVFRKLNNPIKKTKQGYLENCEENNTYINNTMNNTINNVSTFRADDTLPALSKKDSKYTRWAEAMTLFIERYHHQNYWNFKGKSREKAIQEWPKQIRLLIEKDMHGQGTIEAREKQVKAVIRWVYEQSEFWRHNILSADKLRKQYDKLSAQFEQFKKSAAGKRMVNEAKTKEERIRELEQELIYGRSDK
jgi:hypothetical protein